MAADVLNLPRFTIAELATEIAPAPDAAVTLVEGAGGPCSPLATDGDSVSLGRALEVDTVVLVAPAGLGTINAVRLSAAPFEPSRAGSPRLVVALNRFDGDDDLHRRNHGWLASDGFHLVTDPAELAEELLRAHPSGRRIS
jgi:dethiobiotin synthetase